MAVRVAGLPLRARAFSVIFFLVLVHVVVFVLADPTSDALIEFKNSLSNSDALASWDPRVSPPCDNYTPNWVGVLCSAGHVRGLRLENMGLKGSGTGPAAAVLASLPRLRTLSLMNNTLTGPVPNLRPLGRLRSAYLSYNHFSGELPDDAFVGLRFLRKVSLSNNELSGKIPSSLAELPRLEVFTADGNKFAGKIPDFRHGSLKKINVSYNELEGPVPEALSKMDWTSFSGNKNLCGHPLRACIDQSTTNIFLYTTTSLHEKYSQLLKTLVIVLVVFVLFAILVVSLVVFRSRRKTFQVARLGRARPKDRNNNNINKRNNSETGDDNDDDNNTNSDEIVANQQNPRSSNNNNKGELGKLSFVRDDRKRFDLHDLLRASAEVLGSGTFGASYKATVQCESLVVKRYKQMNGVGREEFHEHMRRLGGLSHPNLLPLVAYYYRREEKLLVYDYVKNGSLAFHLHGNRNVDQPALDWPTRLRIIKGVANGLAYLYTALPCLTVPHGHLKSSNIVLSETMEPLMTDYGLLPAINLDHAKRLMMAYKSPEHASLGRVTKKTDVWSLGILILELLTGRFPENYLARGYTPGSDLANWVNEMINEKRTREAFDRDISTVKANRGEMLKVLKIGLRCCEADLDLRFDLAEAVERIEEVSGDLGSREMNSLDGEFFISSVLSSNNNIIGDGHDNEDSYLSRAC